MCARFFSKSQHHIKINLHYYTYTIIILSCNYLHALFATHLMMYLGQLSELYDIWPSCSSSILLVGSRRNASFEQIG